MKPKYTDSFRYPHGYTPSGSTNVAETIARARAELASKLRSEAEMRLRSTITTLKRKA